SLCGSAPLRETSSSVSSLCGSAPLRETSLLLRPRREPSSSLPPSADDTLVGVPSAFSGS
ncbi:MAG: hypothetical protein RIB86_01335, partial [Imperialibacter sp.]